jgi:O-antigen/teichoic acid export membrane protein
MSRDANPSADAVEPIGGSDRGVLRGTAVFAAASVAQRGLAFLLLPLYAAVLTPIEYGQVGVVTAVSAAAGMILGFGLETAVFRSKVLFSTDRSEAEAFVNTVGVFGIVAPVTGAIVGSIVLAPSLSDAFGVPVLALEIAIVGAALAASATAVPLAILRAEERLGDYLRLTGIQAFVGTALTVLAVVVLDLGVTGWMAATTVSSAVLLIRGVMVVDHRWTPRFELRHLRDALAYGLPLVPHAVSHWGLALSDRTVLGALADPREVGAYYVAYQLTLPVSLIAIAVSQGIQPLYARASSSSAARTEIAEATTHQVFVVALLAAAAAVLGPSAVALLLPPAYAAAANFVPWIAAGIGLFGMYLVPMNAVSLIAGRTRWVWPITFVAAMVNIVANVVLVPSFGALAAAINTVVAYAILLGGVSLYASRMGGSGVPYQWRRIAAGVTLIVVGAGSAIMLLPVETLTALVVRSVVMLAIPAALLASGIWSLSGGASHDRLLPIFRRRT